MFQQIEAIYIYTYGLDKIIGTIVKDNHFFSAMELGHHFPLIQFVTFLKYIQVSSECSLVEYCATLNAENVLVAGGMMEEVICFSSYSQEMSTVCR
jgi:hypothetical protein